jgi:hypothetical protein
MIARFRAATISAIVGSHFNRRGNRVRGSQTKSTISDGYSASIAATAAV